MRIDGKFLAASLAVLGATACSSGGGGASGEGDAPASLHVTLSGLPSGASALVHVTGPNGFAVDTAGGDLDGLAPGDYHLSAPDVVVDGLHLPTVWVAIPMPPLVQLTAGDRGSSVVEYAPRAGSGELWIARFGAELSGYADAVLDGTGTATPVAAGVIPSTVDTQGLAVDAAGALWLSDSSGALQRLAPDQLGPTSGGQADTWLTHDSIADAGALALDADGALWVSGTAKKTLARYTPDQFARGGYQAPSVTITLAGNDPAGGLAFDAAGNLWMTLGTSGQVARIRASDLATTATRAAVPLQTAALSSPVGLAFDAAGNLWVACAGSSTVVRFDAASLASAGAVSPSVVLGSASGSLDAARGVAVDADGDLWVLGPDHTVRLDAADLGASGRPTPALTLGVGGWALATNPATP